MREGDRKEHGGMPDFNSFQNRRSRVFRGEYEDRVRADAVGVTPFERSIQIWGEPYSNTEENLRFAFEHRIIDGKHCRWSVQIAN